MKTPLLASLTAKVAAGVAGVALVTGGAGTVLALQPASERTLPATAAEAALEATGRKAAAPTTTTTSTTSTTVASTTTDEKKKDEQKGEAKDVTTSREHPDNFGAMVSEDAQDGGVDGQEISELSRARNEQRRAERTEKTSAADDHRKNGDKGKPEEG